jgi:hypothetical protein
LRGDGHSWKSGDRCSAEPEQKPAAGLTAWLLREISGGKRGGEADELRADQSDLSLRLLRA